MLQAVTYVRSLFGWSKPHLMQCSDGNLYVVKLSSNPQGIRALANEMICCRLAKLLNLPVPDGQVIHIHESLRTQFLELGFNIGDGPHFGSRYIPDSTDNPSDEELGSCINIAQAADMITFDYWLDNNDRYLWRDYGQNILVSRGSDSQIWMIDNANILSGPNWTPESVLNSVSEYRKFWGPLYAKFVPYLDGPNPFDSAIAAINALPSSDLLDITADLPVEWGVNRRELVTVSFALDCRRWNLSNWLLQLKDHFPLWRSEP
ncbi:HipA family kinase [Paenibacillus jiagnxiensis]|uniref:HipA family kinase n=1 Tax=Paenibacillus jiagnxiensis TaxID=3228926 RepID=UPI0033BBF37E